MLLPLDVGPSSDTATKAVISDMLHVGNGRKEEGSDRYFQARPSKMTKTMCPTIIPGVRETGNGIVDEHQPLREQRATVISCLRAHERVSTSYQAYANRRFMRDVLLCFPFRGEVCRSLSPVYPAHTEIICYKLYTPPRIILRINNNFSWTERNAIIHKARD